LQRTGRYIRQTSTNICRVIETRTDGPSAAIAVEEARGAGCALETAFDDIA
jgi:hypothetical protein